MKLLAKKLLNAIAPRWTTALISARARAHTQRLYEKWGVTALNRKLLQHLGHEVQEGPFAGLKLSPMTAAENLGPFLLGVYESELDSAWKLILSGEYERIVDIGAKIGFYAVGLARRFPNVPVEAYDTDWWARRAVAEMAVLNGVSNVTIRGYASSEILEENAGPSFFLSDCEGYEGALFVPAVLPKLRQSTLLIETHDHIAPGVSARLQLDLSNSHDVRLLGTDGHHRMSSLPLQFLSEEEQRLAHNEFRNTQVWILALPREGPNACLATRSRSER